MNIMNTLDKQQIMRNLVFDRFLQLKYEFKMYDTNIVHRYHDLLQSLIYIFDWMGYDSDNQLIHDELKLIYYKKVTVYDIIDNCCFIHGNKMMGDIMFRRVHPTGDGRTVTLSSLHPGRPMFTYSYGQVFNMLKEHHDKIGNINKLLSEILSICFDEWSY